MAVQFIIYCPFEDDHTFSKRGDDGLLSPKIKISKTNDDVDHKWSADSDVAPSRENTSDSEKQHLLSTSDRDGPKSIMKSASGISLSQKCDKEYGGSSLNVASSVAGDMGSTRTLETKGRFQVTVNIAPNGETTGPAPSVQIQLPAEKSYVPDSIASDAADEADVIIERVTLKDALCEILQRCEIDSDVWMKTQEQDFWRIEFIVDASRSEFILHRLIAVGFGRIPGTSVSTFPANVHYDKEHGMMEESKEAFMKSIKSRLTVTQVAMAVQANARLTFDFIVLILLAGMIAGLGLAESSSVVLVASMLISPLMGPIIGFTFGIVIKNRPLWKMSFRNELIGLSICLSYGFLFGLITGGINSSGANWGSSDSWPTDEMKARGMLRSLWVGVLIALPSGAGVALSILGGNTGSLVGVAISASLLPPAVNAGMLWGLALVSSGSSSGVLEDGLNYTIDDYNDDCPLVNGQRCRPLLNNKYCFVYDCNLPSEAAILGSVSLLLTIVNIICIFIAAIGVLKLKEVAPHTALSPQTEVFWKRDIPLARDTYKTVKGAASMDWSKQAKLLLVPQLQEKNATLSAVVMDTQNDPVYQAVTSGMLKVAGAENLLNELKQAEREQLSRSVSLNESSVWNGYHTVHGDSKTSRQMLERCKSFIPNADTPESPEESRGAIYRVRPKTPGDDVDSVLLMDPKKLGVNQRRSLYQRRVKSTHYDATITSYNRMKTEDSGIPEII